MRMVERHGQVFNTRRTGVLGGYVLAGVVVISLALPAAGVIEGDLELLKMTALAQRDNVQRISTWQGSSSVESSHEDAQGVSWREQSTFHFVFSRAHEATRWEWKGQSRYVRPGLTVGDKLVDPNWPWSWTNEMRKGDAFYKYWLGRITKEGQRAGTLVIWPSREAEKGIFSYSFDPMWYLKGRITAGADDLAALLMEYYERAGVYNRNWKINRDADLVIFEMRNEGVLNRFVFDLSKGGSPIQVLIESSAGTQTREWIYEQRGDVWVPKSFTLTCDWLQPEPDGETKLTRKITFTENVLNRPVAATEFSLAKLGVKAGDRVSDHKLGLFYRYGGAEDLPLENVDALREETPAVDAGPSAQGAALQKGAPAPLEPGQASEDANSRQPASPGKTPLAWFGPRASAVLILVFVLSLSAVSFLLLRRKQKREVRP
jgi:hypothetical protein